MNCNPTIPVQNVEGKTVYMGVFTTFNARSVTFDFSAWAEALGEGTFSVSLLRPGEALPYAVAGLAIDGTQATWTFDATDTALAGYGRAFLSYVTADAMDMTVDFDVYIAANSSPNGDTPPEPLETWYQQMLEAAAQAQNAAQSASESAETAREAAEMFPAGGTTGQILAKASDANYDTHWINNEGGGGGALPPGGTDGQYLVRSATAQAGAIWQDLPIFDGSYEVTPLPYMETIMQTQRTYLDRDIVVKEIPYAEVTNEKGGLTATIGG